QVISGEITLGVLMMFISYLAQFYQPLQVLSRIGDWISRCLTAAERIFEILDTDADIEDQEDAVPLPDMRGEVEFRDVTFGYEKYDPVLKDISIHVEPGEMIGLAGKSGS